MTTYKERQENKYNFILLRKGVPLGTFGNLKKVVEFMGEEDFPSYWTLIRKSQYPLVYEDYSIYKVKHY